MQSSASFVVLKNLYKEFFLAKKWISIEYLKHDRIASLFARNFNNFPILFYCTYHREMVLKKFAL